MTEQRNYEQLQVKLRGLENTVEDLVQQASSNLRKELRSVEERLKRQIESSQKDQAAETFNVKRGLSEQFTGEVRAAEDRLTRRMDSERRDHKEAVAELRREVTAQLLAQQQQDTASFATQRVVPKESEELSKLRGVMEDLRSLQEHAQKDATRLAQELKDQKQLCERMDLSMRQHMSKYQTEMLTVRTSVEKVDLAAKQAQKAAETRGASAEQEQERENAFVGCVSDLDAELRRDMRQMVTKVQSDMLSEFKTLLSATQEELENKLKECQAIQRSTGLDLLEQRLKKMEDSRLELRLGKLESAALRASNYSDAGESTLFTSVARRPLGSAFSADNKKVITDDTIGDTSLTRESREARRERSNLDPQLTEMFKALSIFGKSSAKTPGSTPVDAFSGPAPVELVSEDLKNRLESLVEQVKETLNSTHIGSILDSKAPALDDGNYGLAPEPQDFEYEAQGYQDDGGYDYIPNGHDGYVPTGQNVYVANGHDGYVHDGQVPYAPGPYEMPQLASAPMTPIMPPQSPLMVQPDRKSVV